MKTTILVAAIFLSGAAQAWDNLKNVECLQGQTDVECVTGSSGSRGYSKCVASARVKLIDGRYLIANMKGSGERHYHEVYGEAVFSLGISPMLGMRSAKSEAAKEARFEVESQLIQLSFLPRCNNFVSPPAKSSNQNESLRDVYGSN